MLVQGGSGVAGQVKGPPLGLKTEFATHCHCRTGRMSSEMYVRKHTKGIGKQSIVFGMQLGKVEVGQDFIRNASSQESYRFLKATRYE